MANLPKDDILDDYCSDLLHLSLPDNDQTWLHCIHGSDPTAVMDLSYILQSNSSFDDKRPSILADKVKDDDQMNTTFCVPLEHLKLDVCTKLKDTGSEVDSLLTVENSTIMNALQLPISSAQLNQNKKNERNSRIESDDTDLAARLKIEEHLVVNARRSINNVDNINLTSSSNSWNISELTLLANISAPKGFLDSTCTTYDTPSSDLSVLSKLTFNPNSVSTPTKKSVCANKDEISITPECINEPQINTNIQEDPTNDTYNVQSPNEKNCDHDDSITLDVTKTVFNAKIEKTEDFEELEPKETLESTFILIDTSSKNISANDAKLITNEKVIHSVNNIMNKIEPPSFPENADTDFNSTITIKSKNNDDSEEDSCYSSSSNIRSLGDVCTISQLQPQKAIKIDCALTKTRSENSLYSLGRSRNPDKHYGSAINLGTHNTNQLPSERRHHNPNPFLRKPGNQLPLPNVNLPETDSTNATVGKTVNPTRISKIPRLQSKIPKLTKK